MDDTARTRHTNLVRALTAELAGNTQPLRVKKRTISNLFRYDGRQGGAARLVDLSAFDQPIQVDVSAKTLEVQGLATYEQVIKTVLPHGLAPTITPELKHITVGGAIVGVGIETNSFRYGFVHDSLLEADVLLPDGRVVTCAPEGEHADLFRALPNSYGTLGYVLRAKLQLRPMKPYVELTTERFGSTATLLKALQQTAADPGTDYAESLIYSDTELYLTTSRERDQPQDPVTSIYGATVFYRDISRAGRLTLTAADYLFRYDPEWFWALPVSGAWRSLRRLVPRAWRTSSFYARMLARRQHLATKLPFLAGASETHEQLIQDWEVPWAQAQGLLDYALSVLDLDGKPLMTAPIKTPAWSTGYPLRANELYLNLGSYNYVRRRPDTEPYHYTKIMDAYCFAHHGLKMLYSSSFMTEAEFNDRYAEPAVADVKARYDPAGLLPSRYDKVVRAR